MFNQAVPLALENTELPWMSTGCDIQGTRYFD